jgi:hypothetical protein
MIGFHPAVPASDANFHFGGSSQEPPEFVLAMDDARVLYELLRENRRGG